MHRITLITTGGTIEKTYDEQTGALHNRRSIVGRMLRRLRLEDTQIFTHELMSKDSMLMTDDDRLRILEAVRAAGGVGTPDEPRPAAGPSQGIVILHGTDTLADTGELLAQRIAHPRVPIVLTGAMRPFEMTRSDALQNLTEAFFATGLLGPGVYVAAHGRTLAFPGVRKDRERGTFVKG
jgi:L-asparaginase